MCWVAIWVLLEALTQYPQCGDEMARRQAEAKRLLADAGHARGLDIEVIVRRGPLYERPALSRQDDLEKVESPSRLPSWIRPACAIDKKRAAFRPSRRWRQSNSTILTSTMRASPVGRRPTTGNIATWHLISSLQNKAARLMSRRERRSRARWSAYSCTTALMPGGFS
jgi:hypothetical protein